MTEIATATCIVLFRNDDLQGRRQEDMRKRKRNENVFLAGNDGGQFIQAMMETSVVCRETSAGVAYP